MSDPLASEVHALEAEVKRLRAALTNALGLFAAPLSSPRGSGLREITTRMAQVVTIIEAALSPSPADKGAK